MTAVRGDVLVVGAGPAGLTMALELARRGISVRVVDAAAAPSGQTRALGMQARTLEQLERVGVVDELLRHGLRATRFNVFSEGRQILDADFGTLDSAYPFLLMIPQDHTERILAEKLAGQRVRVERSVSLAELTQAPGEVSVTLEHADGSVERTQVAWLVGADGAHSTVRHQLGVDFVGTSFEENFTVADLRVDWSRPQDQFFAFLERGRFMAFFPMLEGWHRVAIARPADDPGIGQVTVEELQRAIDACVPGGAPILEVRQAGRFRINQRRAAAHAVGRVFLVGDAAHIHSVVGAQGMNTGIQDSVNLGWKLSAVIRGEAQPALLESYAAERTPVAERLVRGTLRITRLTLMSDPVRAWLRRQVAPLVLSRARTRLVRAVAQLDLSYHDRSGVAPAGRAAAGDRVPDAPVKFSRGDASRVHDLLDARTHTLVCFDLPPGDAQAIADGCAGPVEVVHLEGEEAAAARFGYSAPGAVLVRPDGYIALRTPRGKAAPWPDQSVSEQSEPATTSPTCPRDVTR